MNYLLLGGILAWVASLGYGLMCHQCQQLADKICSDPYTQDTLGECDDDQYCVKYKTVVKIRDSGYINGWERHSAVVTRSCEAKEGKSEGCTGWQNNGGVTIKCWCGSDGCNQGRSLSPTAAGVVFSCVLSVFMFVFVRWH